MTFRVLDDNGNGLFVDAATELAVEITAQHAVLPSLITAAGRIRSGRNSVTCWSGAAPTLFFTRLRHSRSLRRCSLPSAAGAVRTPAAHRSVVKWHTSSKPAWMSAIPVSGLLPASFWTTTGRSLTPRPSESTRTVTVADAELPEVVQAPAVRGAAGQAGAHVAAVVVVPDREIGNPVSGPSRPDFSRTPVRSGSSSSRCRAARRCSGPRRSTVPPSNNVQIDPSAPIFIATTSCAITVPFVFFITTGSVELSPNDGGNSGAPTMSGLPDEHRGCSAPPGRDSRDTRQRIGPVGSRTSTGPGVPADCPAPVSLASFPNTTRSYRNATRSRPRSHSCRRRSPTRRPTAATPARCCTAATRRTSPSHPRRRAVRTGGHPDDARSRSTAGAGVVVAAHDLVTGIKGAHRGGRDRRLHQSDRTERKHRTTSGTETPCDCPQNPPMRDAAARPPNVTLRRHTATIAAIGTRKWPQKSATVPSRAAGG